MDTTPRLIDVYHCLEPRMTLSATDKLIQQNLNKGEQGEQFLYHLLKKHLPADYLCMKDLLLPSQQTEYQIDLLLIGKESIYPIEVKHYEGDFFMQDECWYVLPSDKEIRNPLHQLKRMEILLKNTLGPRTFDFQIEPYIVFTHPEFFLYQASLDAPLIFPTQIMNWIRQLTSTSFKQTKRHTDIVEFLDSRRLGQSAHEQFPNFTYQDLTKGIVCQRCSNFLQMMTLQKFFCKSCHQEEKIESAIKRNAKEFMILFPDDKVTTTAIFNWCDQMPSKKTIRRVLKKYLTAIGTGRQTYYI